LSTGRRRACRGAGDERHRQENGIDAGIYVTGFCHPVVPQGAARIRVQVSALHTRAMLDRALDAFAAARRAGDV
jgi:glycine C-acetyltransferase